MRGAVLALLMLAFLRLETARRLRRSGGASCSPSCVAVAGLARGAARSTGDTPWWDYEAWALDAARRSPPRSPGTTPTARWTGRATAASCCASRPRRAAYWKAADLDVFDGRHWMRAVDSPNLDGCDPTAPSRATRPIPSWMQEIRVTIRNLRHADVRDRRHRLRGRRARACAGCRSGTACTRPWTRRLRRGDAYTRVTSTRPSRPSASAARRAPTTRRTCSASPALSLPGRGASRQVPTPSAGSPCTSPPSGRRRQPLAAVRRRAGERLRRRPTAAERPYGRA